MEEVLIWSLNVDYKKQQSDKFIITSNYWEWINNWQNSKVNMKQLYWHNINKYKQRLKNCASCIY